MPDTPLAVQLGVHLRAARAWDEGDDGGGDRRRVGEREVLRGAVERGHRAEVPPFPLGAALDLAQMLTLLPIPLWQAHIEYGRHFLGQSATLGGRIA